jgi:hypothetical protein
MSRSSKKIVKKLSSRRKKMSKGASRRTILPPAMLIPSTNLEFSALRSTWHPFVSWDSPASSRTGRSDAPTIRAEPIR